MISRIFGKKAAFYFNEFIHTKVIIENFNSKAMDGKESVPNHWHLLIIFTKKVFTTSVSPSIKIASL